jgi:hypothetical protein
MSIYIRALLNGQPIIIRNPECYQTMAACAQAFAQLSSTCAATNRGWQVLRRRLEFRPSGRGHASGKLWSDCAKVAGRGCLEGNALREAQQLRLDSSKANRRLGWRPRWNIDHAIDKLLEWTEAYQREEDILAISLKQIIEYETVMKA